MYTSEALGIAVRLLPFSAMICVGAFFCGMIVRHLKKLRWPLVAALCTLTLFSGLMALCGPENQSTFLGLLAVVGFSSAFGTIIPVSGTSLSVPSALIGTALQVQQSARALGGTIGITIFSAIFSAKIATYLPLYVAPAAVKAGLPASSLPAVFKALSSGSPQLLTAVPGMAPQILSAVNAAFAEAGSKSFEFVWLAIMAFAASCTLASLLVEEVPDNWTNFVESALENNEVRKDQQHVA